jgi:hypothetical protein
MTLMPLAGAVFLSTIHSREENVEHFHSCADEDAQMEIG